MHFEALYVFTRSEEQPALNIQFESQSESSCESALSPRSSDVAATRVSIVRNSLANRVTSYYAKNSHKLSLRSASSGFLESIAQDECG